MSTESRQQLIEDLGEFGLIGRIEQMFSATGPEILQGIGDDCAILDRGDSCLLLTSDLLVEGVHFQRQWTSPRALGKKALAVNVSDVAAMGGTPTYALLSLGIPRETPVSFLEEFLDGMRERALSCGVSLVGGDTVSTPSGLLISVTLLGRALRADLLYRSGAHSGDRILVSGPLGESRAGLELLRRGVPEKDPDLQPLFRWHRDPVPAFPVGAVIGGAREASAMIDLSDGLSQDLGHLCDRSGVGAVVEEDLLPISSATCKAAELLGEDPLLWVLSGGEDYRLLVAVPGPRVDSLQKQIRRAGCDPLVMIGELVEQRGLQLRSKGGKTKPLAPGGFNHFSPEKRG